MLSQGESILFNVLYCQKVIYLFSVTFSVLHYLEADLINFHVEWWKHVYRMFVIASKEAIFTSKAIRSFLWELIALGLFKVT